MTASSSFTLNLNLIEFEAYLLPLPTPFTHSISVRSEVVPLGGGEAQQIH